MKGASNRRKLKALILMFLVTAACTGRNSARTAPARAVKAPRAFEAPAPESQPAVDAAPAVEAHPLTDAGAVEPQRECKSDVDCVLTPGPPLGCEWPCGGCRAAVPRGQ